MTLRPSSRPPASHASIFSCFRHFLALLLLHDVHCPCRKGGEPRWQMANVLMRVVGARSPAERSLEEVKSIAVNIARMRARRAAPNSVNAVTPTASSAAIKSISWHCWWLGRSACRGLYALRLFGADEWPRQSTGACGQTVVNRCRATGRVRKESRWRNVTGGGDSSANGR
jgi:hypothetical protein